jgi:hypothetical protein
MDVAGVLGVLSGLPAFLAGTGFSGVLSGGMLAFLTFTVVRHGGGKSGAAFFGGKAGGAALGCTADGAILASWPTRGGAFTGTAGGAILGSRLVREGALIGAIASLMVKVPCGAAFTGGIAPNAGA